MPLNEPAGEGRVSGVTGCRGSVARSRGLTLAVLPPTHHQLPAASPQYTHHPSSPWNPLLASKTGTSFPKAAMSLSLLTAAGGAAPGPVQRGARVDTHKGPSSPQPSGGGNRGADRTRRRVGRAGGPGTRPLRHPTPQIQEPRNCPSRVPTPADAGSRRPYLQQQPEQQRRHPAEPAAHGSREARPKPGCAAGSEPVHTRGPACRLRGNRPTPAQGRAASRRSSRTCRAVLAARPRPTARARARGLGAGKVCGARCGTRSRRAGCEVCQVSPFLEETILSHLDSSGKIY